tara:strand:+ start:53 stop:496 length:444 start_codon:yes stop_codon:yes gene_type:complete
MAHFAKIDNDNIVLQVLTLDNASLLNDSKVETESVGQAYLETHNNWPANLWIQTSYNTVGNEHLLGGTPFRGNYASIGYTWDITNQIFWPPKPYTSWVKNTTIARWESPIGAQPELTQEQKDQNTAETHFWDYDWNEDNQTWDLINH